MNFCLSLKLKAALQFRGIFEYHYSNRGGCAYWMLEGQTCNATFQAYKLSDINHTQDVYVGEEMHHHVDVEHLVKY